jgi:anti-anti-sigma factor
MMPQTFVSPPMATNGGSGQLQINLDVAHARIAVTGELDLATVHVLHEAAAFLMSETAEAITIDLSGLQFIDAAGLGEIVGLRATLIAADRRLTLSRPSPTVRRTFAVGGLAKLLPENSSHSG